MGRTSILVIVALLVGLGIGWFAGSAATATLERRAHASDFAAIEKLHQADIEATLKQDPVYLGQLWSDDCIKVDGPNGPVVGLKAIKEMYAKLKADYPEFKVLEYAPDYKSTQYKLAIAGDWAIEVGATGAVYQMSSKDKPVSVPKTEGMRVMKKQSDGSWKFAVVGLR